MPNVKGALAEPPMPILHFDYVLIICTQGPHRCSVQCLQLKLLLPRSRDACYLNDVPVEADALQQFDLVLKLLQLGRTAVPKDFDGHILHAILEAAVHLQPAGKPDRRL